MTDAVRADALEDGTVAAPQQLPVTHVVIAGVVDHAGFLEHTQLGAVDVDERGPEVVGEPAVQVRHGADGHCSCTAFRISKASAMAHSRSK